MVADVLALLKKNIGLVAAAGFLLIIVVVAVIYFTEDGGGDKVYDVPIGFEEESDYNWGDVDISSSANKPSGRKLPVYWGAKYDISEVEPMVKSFGFTGEPEISGDGVFYAWVRGEEFARYSTITGDLSIYSSAIPLSEIQKGYFDDENIEEYFGQFMSEYIGLGLDYQYEYERGGSSHQFTGSWFLQDHPVVYVGGQEYSFIVKFDNSGDLQSLYVRLMRVSETDEKVQLVSLSDLRSYIRLEGYPKEAFVDVVPEGSDCNEESDCDPYGFYLAEDGFDVASLTDVSFAYLYDFEGEGDIVPIYRLEGEGRATDENGTSREISVVVFANAIDPSRIVTSEE